MKYHCRKCGWVLPVVELNGDRFCECGYFLSCIVVEGTCKDKIKSMIKMFPDSVNWDSRKFAIILGMNMDYVCQVLKKLRN